MADSFGSFLSGLLDAISTGARGTADAFQQDADAVSQGQLPPQAMKAGGQVMQAYGDPSVNPVIPAMRNVKMAFDPAKGWYEAASKTYPGGDWTQMFMRQGGFGGLLGNLLQQYERAKSNPLVSKIDTLFRGGGKFDPSKVIQEIEQATETGASFSTSKDIAKKFGEVLEYTLKPNAKIADSASIAREYAKSIGSTVEDIKKYPTIMAENLAEFAKKKGFDALDLTKWVSGEQEIRVFNPAMILEKK